MVEVIGDPVEPSDFILPKHEGTRSVRVGDAFISGDKIWFHDGTIMRVVTST